MHGVYDSLTFPSVQPPATLTWEIATVDNQRVGLTINDIQPTSVGQLMQWSITEANAAQYGVDWGAWQAAALNPAFTRSILRFGSTIKEGPLVRNNFTDAFVLGSFGVGVDKYVWPPDRLGFVLNPTVNAGAAGLQVIPEPATWLLTASLLSLNLARLREQGQRCMR
jgi:hypothetical protein